MYSEISVEFPIQIVDRDSRTVPFLRGHHYGRPHRLLARKEQFWKGQIHCSRLEDSGGGDVDESESLWIRYHASLGDVDAVTKACFVCVVPLTLLVMLSPFLIFSSHPLPFCVAVCGAAHCVDAVCGGRAGCDLARDAQGQSRSRRRR